MIVQPAYEPRFVTQAQLTELFNLYHLARTGLCVEGAPIPSRYDRTLWTCRMFCKENPDVKETAAYKDLTAAMDAP